MSGRPELSPILALACSSPSPLGEARADIPDAVLRHTAGSRPPSPRRAPCRCRSASTDRTRPSICPTEPGPTGRRPGADLVLDRPARREPGARQPDGRRAQAALLRPARRARLQGDRGRLPRGLEDRLRLRPRAGRGRAHPGRHDDRGAHAGAAGADRAHVRGDRRAPARDRPPLQLDLGDAAPRRLPARQGRDHRARRARHRALPRPRRRDPTRRRLPVLARELPPHGARLRARDLRGGRRRVGPDAGREDDRQPADDGRAVPAERLRRPDRVVRPPLLAARLRRSSRCIRTTTAARRSRRPSSG